MIREKLIVGKNHPKIGNPPAIILNNPKYPHNVGQAIRACSCFGVNQLFYSGDRVSLEHGKENRIPREERMKGYGDVDVYQYDKPFDLFEKKNVTPVAVELQPNAELLPNFEHPENPVYVFGPEDGSIQSTFRQHCHQFLVIPTRHCTNLSAALYLVLYDRLLKQMWNGDVDINHINDVLNEERGWYHSEGDKSMSLDQVVGV